jgi:putative two-component system response regulator
MTNGSEKIKTVLIVDDTPENVSLLEAILSADYITKTANSGKDALKIAMETPPDLILLDIMMPEMDGYEVCKALKQNDATKGIPVIFVTALLDSGDETSGFEAGGVDYITKPVVGAIVRSRVKAHLALKEVQNDLEDWNRNLKKRLLYSISTIRKDTEKLMSADERAFGLEGRTQSVELLSGVFELMEDRFGVSSRAVSELAGDAARKMKMPAEGIAKIRLAGLLHNAGTLGANRVKLSKHESEMSSNEMTEYLAHPVRGQELFNSLEELHDVGLMVRGHHEAYNGNGFPDGLKGDDIPIGARLIAIADVIENAANSVSGERDDYALMIARRQAGTRLDPRLISNFSMITRILYVSTEKSLTPGEVEVSPDELITGMKLSRDYSTESGVLLLQKGDTLDPAGIAIIRRKSGKTQAQKSGVWMYVDIQ